MRLGRQEFLPGGRKRVFQVQPDGSERVVWEGTLVEFLTWTPPECLRYPVESGDGEPEIEANPMPSSRGGRPGSGCGDHEGRLGVR